MSSRAVARNRAVRLGCRSRDAAGYPQLRGSGHSMTFDSPKAGTFGSNKHETGRRSDSDHRPGYVRKLHVVVESELVGVRTQPQRVDLVLALEGDPGLDDVRGEHATLEQELVVRLKVVENLVQRSRDLGHALGLLGRELVEV